MKRCNICEIEVDTHKEYCPLCYNYLNEIEPKATPEFFEMKSNKTKSKKKAMTAKIFFIISIILITTSVFINVATETVAWSAIVGLGIFYLWVLIAHTIISRDTPFKKVALQLVSVVAFLVATNYIFGGTDWFTSYVFPSLACATSIILTFIIMCSKKRKNYYFSFMVIELALLAVSAVFVSLKIGDMFLLNSINIAFQSIVCISYLIFAGKTIRTQAVRKLHI
jgi:hypothetical protein